MKKCFMLFVSIFSLFVFIRNVNALSCTYYHEMSTGHHLAYNLNFDDNNGLKESGKFGYVIGKNSMEGASAVLNYTSVSFSSPVKASFDNVDYTISTKIPSSLYNKKISSCPSANIVDTKVDDLGNNFLPSVNGGHLIMVTFTDTSTSISNNGENESNSQGGVTIGNTYCSNPNFIKPFKLLGKIFGVIKILIPIIIIAFGVWDFFRAVVAAKDDEIKKSMKSLVMRLIAGVIIFFLPAIIHFVFKLIDDWDQYESDYSKCSLCLVEPNKC